MTRQRPVAMAAALAALAWSVAAIGAAPLLPVDDSYTASSRYESYKEQYPGIALPELSFQRGQRIQFDRRYKVVGDRELHLDVFLPPSGGARGRQAIVFVHGGGWRAGNKSEFYPLAGLLAQRGYVVFLPEFRLSPEARYPAGLIDVSDAIAWVRAHADTYGVDPGRIALSGGSSGGQMAALLAYASSKGLFKTNPADDTRVNALIDFDGVLDFTTPLALQYENAAGDASYAAMWLGGSMQHAPNTWREASAATYAGSGSPPTLIVSSGAPRFTAGREAVLAVLERNRIRHEYVELSNVPHTFWLFEPYLGDLADRVDSFLKAVRQ